MTVYLQYDQYDVLILYKLVPVALQKQQITAPHIYEAEYKL